MSLRLLFLILLIAPTLGVLSACVSASPRDVETASRSVAASQDRVMVDLPDGKVFEIAAPQSFFGLASDLTSTELQRLTDYLKLHRSDLGAPPVAKDTFDLNIVSQSNTGSKIFVRLQQVNRRSAKAMSYEIPVVGANLVVVLEAGRIVRIMSHLTTPPALQLGFTSSGVRLEFTNEEIAVLMDAIKTNLDQRDRFIAYFDIYARKNGVKNPFPQILNIDVPTQKKMLETFFAAFGRVSAAQLFVSAANKRQLSYVKYGAGQWMYQVTRTFELPIQFDVELPLAANQPFRFKNLRELRTRISTAEPFDSPFFPTGKKTPNGPAGERAAERLDLAAKYFADTFGWKSFKQKDADATFEVHGAVRFVAYRENAAWNTAFGKFIVGAGGPTLSSFDTSLSVLGHEYTHALVQYTSGLTYVGESGALNEHFADIQGASLEAAVNKTPFSYDMGGDTLTDATKAERVKLIPLITAERYHFTDEQTKKYSLTHPSMRNFYAPKLSLGAQFETVDEYRKEFGESCQPSSTNDNCGVHAASGIPNRAAALIIGELGLEETRTLFFNTVVYRLSASSNFRDYLTQLMQECRETPALSHRCDVIEKSFKVVGVSLTEVKRGPEINGPATSTAQHIVPEGVLITPDVRMCGWVDTHSADRWKIIDGKFDTSILRRNFPITTTGDVQSLPQLSCACVKGSVTQATDVRENIFNAFANVVSIDDRGSRCANEPNLAALKPQTTVSPVVLPKKYCGWVSISPTKAVTVVDGRFNAVLTPEKTRGDYSAILSQECACIRGDVEYSETKEGRASNKVLTLVPGSVEPRPVNACFGIRWK